LKHFHISKKVSGMSGILFPIIATIFIFISILLNRDWFSFSENALSDLGALSTPYNFVFNLGLIVSGIIAIIFALGLKKISNDDIFGKIGTTSFILGMIFLTSLGFLPTGLPLHTEAAISFFVLTVLGIIFIGVSEIRSEESRIYGVYIFSIIILLLSSIALIANVPHDIGVAIPEAIASVGIAEFTITYSLRMLDIA